MNLKYLLQPIKLGDPTYLTHWPDIYEGPVKDITGLWPFYGKRKPHSFNLFCIYLGWYVIVYYPQWGVRVHYNIKDTFMTRQLAERKLLSELSYLNRTNNLYRFEMGTEYVELELTEGKEYF